MSPSQIAGATLLGLIALAILGHIVLFAGWRKGVVVWLAVLATTTFVACSSVYLAGLPA